MSVKTATFKRLLESLKVFKSYRVSTARIFELTTDEIQRFIYELADDGYSMATIKKEYHLLTAFIRFSVGEGLMSRPLYINVNLPKQDRIKKPPKQIEAYTPPEQARIRAAIHPSVY